MQLYEQYAIKHNLDANILQRVKEGCFLFKKENSWRLAEIRYSGVAGSFPENYTFKIYRPAHDGYVKSNLFELDNEIKVFWEDYEEVLYDILQQTGKENIVIIPQEVNLTFWEIYIYCLDVWFAQNNFSHMLYDSIDPEINFDARFRCQEEVLKILRREHYKAFKHWCDIAVNLDIYLYWLKNIKF